MTSSGKRMTGMRQKNHEISVTTLMYSGSCQNDAYLRKREAVTPAHATSPTARKAVASLIVATLHA